jgi:hypothetical protein
MERVATYVLGPLTLTEKRNRYILVLCICFRNWTEAFAMLDQESLMAISSLVDEFICRY